MNELQFKEFEIFQQITSIFKKYNLQYFAIGGTCIGAIRHQGFIPWDDDIDIGMPRDDYELFRTKYYRELPPKYIKIDGDNVRSHNFLFTKVHDSTTTYVENYAKGSFDRYTGVFVDIMPIDGFPSNPKVAKTLNKKIEKLAHLNDLNRPWKADETNFSEAIKGGMKKILQKIFKYNFFSNRIKQIMVSHPYQSSKYVYFTWRTGSEYKRKVYPKKYFQKTIEVPFETGEINVPVMYDDYLKTDFGDYMKLPSFEEQKSVHSVYINDMNKPCSAYANEEKRKVLGIK